MGKWQKCGSNAVCWEGSGIKVKLKSEGIRLADEFPECLKKAYREHKVEIADAIVPEWQEIGVKVTKHDGKSVEDIEKVWFGAGEAKKREENSTTSWCFTFRNYLGKSVIRIEFADGRKVETDPIEVVSPKTPLDKPKDSLFYPNFLRSLIDDLIRHLVSLPFDWAAPTGFMTEEHPQPQSPIFVLHVLAQKANEIRYALQTILRNPHRRLVTEERWVRLNEASSVDADTILMMLQHPEFLHPCRSSALATLTTRLKGKAPERVFERRVTETLDTPENRFVKRFMDIILFWCDELERLGYWEKAVRHRDELGEMRDFVRFVRADPLFAEVGEMEIFPASSQVLLKRDGYRECLQIYRLLHIARVPIFDRIQDAIDNRRIDQLYEFWCFFKLAEKLAEKLEEKLAGSKQVEFKPTLQPTDGSLQWGLKAQLSNDLNLVYNKQFEHGKCGMSSYSVPLRPDFSVLKKDGQVQVVFDAKFRFDVQDWDKVAIDDEMDDAQKEGDMERLAKHADICKMHTYRDALQCRAAIILFPGTKGKFYCINGERTDNPCLLDIVQNEHWKGVGAIPFVPKSQGEQT